MFNAGQRFTFTIQYRALQNASPHYSIAGGISAIIYDEERMPRPRNPRQVSFSPEVTYFKPAGVPLRDLDEVVLRPDELEALRLADLEGLYQEDAAARMAISRPTFARLVEAARKKVATALVNGSAIRLEYVSDPAAAAVDKPPCGCGLPGHRGGCRWNKSQDTTA